MNTLVEAVEKFKNYLLANYPERHKAFSDLERSEPESVRAMAGLFSMFKSQGFEVTIYEDSSTGGPDLLCKKLEDAFLVEVTSLAVDTVSARSGLELGAESGWFGPITHLLRNRASAKASQLSGSQTPRLLVITTEHESGERLMGIQAVKSLLTSDPKIEIQPPESEIRAVTDLENSVFFRFSRSGNIEGCRQSISAILLAHVLPNECKITGVLHPQSAFKFPIRLLPTVPFVWVCQWPPKEQKVGVEWSVANPVPAKLHY